MPKRKSILIGLACGALALLGVAAYKRFNPPDIQPSLDRLRAIDIPTDMTELKAREAKGVRISKFEELAKESEAHPARLDFLMGTKYRSVSSAINNAVLANRAYAGFAPQLQKLEEFVRQIQHGVAWDRPIPECWRIGQTNSVKTISVLLRRKMQLELVNGEFEVALKTGSALDHLAEQVYLTPGFSEAIGYTVESQALTGYAILLQDAHDKPLLLKRLSEQLQGDGPIKDYSLLIADWVAMPREGFVPKDFKSLTEQAKSGPKWALPAYREAADAYYLKKQAYAHERLANVPNNLDAFEAEYRAIRNEFLLDDSEHGKMVSHLWSGLDPTFDQIRFNLLQRRALQAACATLTFRERNKRLPTSLE